MTVPTPTSASPPQHIFVIRHGARLDAADKTWHHSSATPYDTPLTYGGWNSARNLGIRISTLLASVPSTKKHRRIILHTSPFQRCIQTSVSIATGFAQYHHQQAVEAQYERELEQENKATATTAQDVPITRFTKPTLRIDAWLGEWMTEDYYTEITPPPVSHVMARTSKEEYMRPPVGITPGAVRRSSMEAVEEEGPSTCVTGGFLPPTPSYAVSSSGPIPHGFYSQAQDYVTLDHSWNSTLLGEGAELGEEWSSMHKRFRAGYSKLLSHYSEPAGEAAAEDTEDVIILVSHGAGCNALLGALTDKPVLLDIGILSLTWASLKTATSPNGPHYSIKLAANTEHLRPGSSASMSSTSSTSSYGGAPRSPYLASRARIPGGTGGFVLASAGVTSETMATLKTGRSASSGTGMRPTGLWSMPRPEDRERTVNRWVSESAVESSPTETTPTESFKDLSLGKPAQEKSDEVAKDYFDGVFAVAKDPVEFSGATVEGGVKKGTGLWAARAWGTTTQQQECPMKRRWTVGREGWTGAGTDH
ncbi:hypothetical protein BZA77DRAFT_289097 [Pyronema omphalodes]|nr:hypothetical protein BZA77DRAFT_289097 [Pyronema omphalodes]